MIEYPLIFLGGLLGSSHCIGMCGALAFSVGMGAQRFAGNIARQAAYSLGRLTTYAFLGAAAGFIGWTLNRQTAISLNLQASLALLSGLFLIWQGLRSAGALPSRLFHRSTGDFCPARSAFATFLTSPGWHNAFLAGLLTGFLPCGLVYAYLALAAAGGALPAGALAMVVFGLGTMPLMILTGIGATALSLAARRNVLRVAAVCVIVTGVLTIHRGVNALEAPFPGNGAAFCPSCDASHGLSVTVPRP
jgi:sulfite exporter TauE/SafE